VKRKIRTRAMATELAEGGLHELARLAGQAVRALDV
jgi:hypothetical protein